MENKQFLCRNVIKRIRVPNNQIKLQKMNDQQENFLSFFQIRSRIRKLNQIKIEKFLKNSKKFKKIQKNSKNFEKFKKIQSDEN